LRAESGQMLALAASAHCLVQCREFGYGIRGGSPARGCLWHALGFGQTPQGIAAHAGALASEKIAAGAQRLLQQRGCFFDAHFGDG